MTDGLLSDKLGFATDIFSPMTLTDILIKQKITFNKRKE